MQNEKVGSKNKCDYFTLATFLLMKAKLKHLLPAVLNAHVHLLWLIHDLDL